MQLSHKEKKRVDAVTKILAGFRPGARVIIARKNYATRGEKGTLLYRDVPNKGWDVRLDSGPRQFFYEENLDLI